MADGVSQQARIGAEGFALGPLDSNAGTTRSGTIANRVFVAIRQAIVRCGFAPGHLLSEAELARQLGVSRQPVREAFIKLAEIGLVEIRPQRGTFVTLVSRGEVQSARFLREAIEAAVVRRAGERAKDDDIARLRAILDEQRAAAGDPDPGAFFALDDRFHSAVADIADCAPAWRVIEDLKVQMDRVRFLALFETTVFETVIGQHAAVIQAIDRRDADGAERAMRTHLGEMLETLPQIAQAHPDYFID